MSATTSYTDSEVREAHEVIADQFLTAGEAPRPERGTSAWNEAVSRLADEIGAIAGAIPEGDAEFWQAVEDADDELEEIVAEVVAEYALSARVARLIAESVGFASSYGAPEVKAFTREGAGIVEIRVERNIRCPRCTQDVRVKGRVVSFDQFGNKDGEYSHQHGCGEWNSPNSKLIHIYGDGDEADTEIADAIASVIAEDDADQEAREAAARYAVEEAQEELDQAEESLSRAEGVLEEARDGGADADAIEAAESAVENAREDVEYAANSLQAAEDDLYISWN